MFLLIPFLGVAQDVQTITFESKDGLELTADLYMPNEKKAPFIILFHQARWSRGEYKEIAPKLTILGFNCLAVDLRSGGEVNNVRNESSISAQKAMKPTKYVDAYTDIEAAVNYVERFYAEGKIIIWGSSYSSALVLKYAGENLKLGLQNLPPIFLNPFLLLPQEAKNQVGLLSLQPFHQNKRLAFYQQL